MRPTSDSLDLGLAALLLAVVAFVVHLVVLWRAQLDGPALVASGALWASAIGAFGLVHLRSWRNHHRARTTRRRLEDLEHALDQAAIVAFTDAAGRITSVNDKLCEATGYSRDELVGQTHGMLSSGVHDAAFYKDLWHTISRGDIWRGEICNKRRDGGLYWVDTTIVPFVGEGGRPYQYLAIRFDITARKHAQERLRQQQSLARLGEMAAVVAHEIKNPLAGIKAALQVIGGRMPEDSAERRVLGDVGDRVDALHRSLKDMLVFARPRELRRAPEELRTLLQETAREAGDDPLVGDVRIDVEGGPLVVDVDRASLREAVLNLVLNAAQAMAGQGRVTLRIEPRGDVCAVHVEDQGPGMPDDVRERVFEPFFTTRTRGTGLGLAIVRRTVEAHDGSVTVTCPERGGTVVTFTLPVVETTHPEGEVAHTPDPAPPTEALRDRCASPRPGAMR